MERSAAEKPGPTGLGSKSSQIPREHEARRVPGPVSIPHGEASVRAKLDEMVAAKLPRSRTRVEERRHSTSPGRAAEARRLLDRLNVEHGPNPQHSQS